MRVEDLHHDEILELDPGRSPDPLCRATCASWTMPLSRPSRSHVGVAWIQRWKPDAHRPSR